MGDFIRQDLLTDDQLRESVGKITWHGFYNDRQANIDELIELFNGQKQAHADMVIGELIKHTDQCLYYKKTHRDSSLCICEARPKNQLINLQRIRNKGGQSE